MPFRTASILRAVAAVLLFAALLGDADAQERAAPIDLARPLSLQDCIGVALQHNRLLLAADAQHHAVDMGVGVAVGTWWPEFEVAALRSSTHGDTDGLGSAIQGNFVEDTATDLVARVTQRLPFGGGIEARYDFNKDGSDLHGAYGGSLFLRQPLLRDAGRRLATADISDAELAASGSEAQWRARSLEVQFQVKQAYYEVLRRRELIEVSKQAIARDEQLLAFSQAKVDAQLATRRDVLSAEIILAQDRSRLVNAETEHKGALDALASWMGIDFNVPFEIVVVPLELEPIPIAETAWVQKALRENPDVQSASYDVQRNELSEMVAGNARLPRLDVTVLYGRTDAAISPTERLLSARRTESTWEGGLELAVPFNNQSLASAHRAAKYRLERGQTLLDEAQRQVVLQVRDAARNLKRIEDRISVLQKEIQGAKDKVEFANVNFQLGRASNLDITDAQEDLVNAQSDYVDEVVGYRVELARLERLLGGSIP